MQIEGAHNGYCSLAVFGVGSAACFDLSNYNAPCGQTDAELAYRF